MKELIEIQSRLNAPKNLFNSFGNYRYRSCEAILEAVKPLLKEQQCVLLLSDEIKEIGQPYTITKAEKSGSTTTTATRIYVEATATIINSKGDKFSVKALAREELEKRGMDAAQVTGATSSYARKYALNGLFCIDDNKDPDATNDHGASQATKPTNATPKPQVVKSGSKTGNTIVKLIEECTTSNAVKDIWNAYPQLQADPTFKEAITKRGSELKAQGL